MGAVLLMALITSAQQDEKAKNILDQVSKKTRSFKTISAEFAFTMQNKEMEIDERNEGSIKLKGQKYCVNLPDIGMRIFSDGTTVWNYMKDGNQVTISNIDDENSELMDPSSLFSIYEKGFISKFISENKVGNKVLYNIDLFPDSTEQDISKISISIDKESLMLHSALLYGTDGNLYGIELKKLETNIDFAESDLMFDKSKYGDVEIIDFR